MAQSRGLSSFPPPRDGGRELAVGVPPDLGAYGLDSGVERLAPSRRWSRLGLFAAIVPTLWAAVYYGFVASDRYVSETQFIVRGVQGNRSTGLDSLFRTFGIARTADDSNAIAAYMASRDALRGLEASLPMLDIFTRPEADLPSKYPHVVFADSFERRFDYYLERTAVVPDFEKGITTLRVEAYRPQDAQDIARRLMDLAESVANRMNARARDDAVSSAEEDLAAAQTALLGAQAELTRFRDASLMVDPAKASSAQLETITGLATTLGQTLAASREGKDTTPNSPANGVLKARSEALKAQIAQERAKFGGDDKALAAQVSKFEELAMLRGLAEKAYAAAVTSLQSARQEASRRQIYVEEVVAPNLADESTRPQRLRNVASTAFVSLGLLAVGWILSVGAKEHGN